MLLHCKIFLQCRSILQRIPRHNYYNVSSDSSTFEALRDHAVEQSFPGVDVCTIHACRFLNNRNARNRVDISQLRQGAHKRATVNRFVRCVHVCTTGWPIFSLLSISGKGACAKRVMDSHVRAQPRPIGWIFCSLLLFVPVLYPCTSQFIPREISSALLGLEEFSFRVREEKGRRRKEDTRERKRREARSGERYCDGD